MSKNYWGFRVDNRRHAKFLYEEILNGKLRQGWGWDTKQDLTNLQMDEGAKKNLPIYNKVKKGDILLIPKIPDMAQVTIVEALEDFKNGYKFDLPPSIGDYGHSFPVKYLNKFVRSNENITGLLRSTLKQRQRFWRISFANVNDIEKILSIPETELSKQQLYKVRFENSVNKIFNETFDVIKFKTKLYDEMTKQFSREEWEWALVEGLKNIFPFYEINRVGGIKEAEHGTDIIIKIPGILADEYEYAIAIQVKDYKGFVSEKVILQISKSDEYWATTENLKIIEKVVIIIGSHKEENQHLLSNKSNVKFIFSNELKEILSEIGQKFVGIKE